jgi:NAD(P)H dehydrogenase (quinone)
VPVQHVDDEAYAEIMSGAGVPEQVVPMLVAFQSGMRKGALDVVSNDLQNLLGRPATPLGDAIRHIVNRLKS